MSFNLDPTKQAQEIIFSRKTSQRNHLGLMFNNSIVDVTSIHKHLDMIFDSKLTLEEHLKSVLKKISKTVALLENSKLSFLEHPLIAITSAIRGTSSEKLCQELGLESLRSRRWLRKLCLFYKIYKNESPSSLYNLIPDRVKFYSTRSSQIDNISNIKTRSNLVRNSFFPSAITEWNKLGNDNHNSDSLNVYKLCLLKFVRTVANRVFEINSPYGLNC